MSSRITVIAIAVVFAAAATLSVFLYARGLQENAVTSTDTVGVVVVSQDIPSDTELDGLLSGGALEIQQVPADLVVSNAVTDLDELKGESTASPILAGEQVSSTRLAGSQDLPGGVLSIPKGMQGMTVALESQRVIGGGVLNAGDHVAIFATFPNEKHTVVVSSDAQVLRISRAAEGTTAGPATTQSGTGNNVTLALDPEEVQKLVFGQDLGKIYFSIIPPGEDGKPLEPITFDSFGNLLGGN
jgi:pilus assembly protein CpaB